VNYRPEGIRISGENRGLPIEVLRHKKVWAFTGIGNPESFRNTLMTLEPQVLGFVAFPDHYWFRPQDLTELTEKGEEKGAEALVTTEKDAVRLEGLAPGSIPLWIVCVKPYFLNEEQKKFEEFLRVKLGWE
jgi:tetraacyldisaccharide 4'-kinase